MSISWLTFYEGNRIIDNPTAKGFEFNVLLGRVCDHSGEFARRQGGDAGCRDGIFQVVGLVDTGIGGTDGKTLSILHGLAEPFRHQPGGFTTGLAANDIPG
jgi:hypothetical protein